MHAVVTSLVFCHVSSNHLDYNSPQKDIKSCNFRELVNILDDEMSQIQNRYKMLVARILFKHFTKFASMKPYISEELILSHENSEATAIKSDIITMPVLAKDEKQTAECGKATRKIFFVF